MVKVGLHEYLKTLKGEKELHQSGVRGKLEEESGLGGVKGQGKPREMVGWR